MNYLIAASLAALTYYGYAEVGHGKHGRVGVLYNPVDHDIVEVYRNSPAALAGIKRKDVVLHINDVDIVGPAYTLVSITIKHPDGTIETLTIERVPAAEIDVRHPLPHEDKNKT